MAAATPISESSNATSLKMSLVIRQIIDNHRDIFQNSGALCGLVKL